MSRHSALIAEPCEARSYPCEVLTTCQPPSGWGKDPWPAIICAVATTGLSLRLGRRFERGSGLAIELPTEYGGSTTVLARVSHVVPENGGWLLNCALVSELSDEEVKVVRDRDPHRHDHLEGPSTPAVRTVLCINGVLFQARVAGEIVRWYVKRLDLTGTWPLPKGKSVSFRLDGLVAELLIKKCRLFGSHWIVDCHFRDAPTTEVLRGLTTPA